MSSEPDNKLPAKSVVTAPKRRWFHGQRRLTVSLIVLIAVVIAGVGVSWWLLTMHHNEQKTATSRSTNTQAAITALRKQQYSAAQRLLSQGPDANSRNNLMWLATAETGAHNYKSALQTYQRIQLRYGLDYSLAVNMAQVEQDLGDKTAALKDYQQALQLVQQNASSIPDSQQTIAGLKSIIKQLGGS